METEVVHTTRKVSQFYFFPYFELFCIIDIFPVQIIALSRNVMLMVHRELGLPVVYHNGYPFSTRDQDNDNYGGNCAVQCKPAW